MEPAAISASAENPSVDEQTYETDEGLIIEASAGANEHVPDDVANESAGSVPEDDLNVDLESAEVDILDDNDESESLDHTSSALPDKDGSPAHQSNLSEKIPSPKNGNVEPPHSNEEEVEIHILNDLQKKSTGPRAADDSEGGSGTSEAVQSDLRSGQAPEKGQNEILGETINGEVADSPVGAVGEKVVTNAEHSSKDIEAATGDVSHMAVNDIAATTSVGQIEGDKSPTDEKAGEEVKSSRTSNDSCHTSDTPVEESPVAKHVDRMDVEHIVEDIQKILKVDKDPPAARKLFQETIKIWTQAAQLTDQDEELTRTRFEPVAQLWLEYASMERRLHQYKQTVKVFEGAVSDDHVSKMSDVWLSYAKFCIERKKFANAQKVFLRAADAVEKSAVGVIWEEFLNFVRSQGKPEMTLDDLATTVLGASKAKAVLGEIKSANAAKDVASPSGEDIMVSAVKTTEDIISEKHDEAVASGKIFDIDMEASNTSEVTQAQDKARYTREPASANVAGKVSTESSNPAPSDATGPAISGKVGSAAVKRRDARERVVEESANGQRKREWTPRSNVTATRVIPTPVVPSPLPPPPPRPPILVDAPPSLDAVPPLEDRAQWDLDQVIAQPSVVSVVRDMLVASVAKDEEYVRRWDKLYAGQYGEGQELQRIHLVREQSSGGRHMDAKQQHLMERDAFGARCRSMQKKFSEQTILEYSRILEDQQALLQRIGVPLMRKSNDMEEIIMQRHIVQLIMAANRTFFADINRNTVAIPVAIPLTATSVESTRQPQSIGGKYGLQTEAAEMAAGSRRRSPSISEERRRRPRRELMPPEPSRHRSPSPLGGRMNDSWIDDDRHAIQSRYRRRGSRYGPVEDQEGEHWAKRRRSSGGLRGREADDRDEYNRGLDAPYYDGAGTAGSPTRPQWEASGRGVAGSGTFPDVGIRSSSGYSFSAPAVSGAYSTMSSSVMTQSEQSLGPSPGMGQRGTYEALSYSGHGNVESRQTTQQIGDAYSGARVGVSRPADQVQQPISVSQTKDNLLAGLADLYNRRQGI